MENVVAFNNELSGLYDAKPPISKAKMASITKSAMRAIKFYKHVVQSVEKFILKCKPEYKVPGLYVIDSIVRQSRHQYGAEKDVFAPRFARNITETFANLFRCAPEDKSRIVRVLNLWQKNNVFAPEVIQPIFDLADPSHPIYQMQPGSGLGSGVIGGGLGSGPSGLNLADTSSTSNGLSGLDMVGGGMMGGGGPNDDKLSGLPDLSNNNLKQLLNDPNVLRQLQTLQNFQKFKQQEDQKHKLDLRLQEEAFEKHLQNVLKGTAGMPPGMNDSSDMNKDVEFVSEQQSIEVINLDGNDSRSPTPDRDRYKRRRNSRSRSRSPRDRGGRRRRTSRSRSRSRSQQRSSNRRRTSRERDRMERNNRDKERDREHERERRKKGLPELKKDHLSVCSTTLWVGHLSKLVYQEELSDTFGEYGDIVSIDLIVPRGCAFIVMHRRQDAYKAMQALKNHKLQGRTITISWAAGKGVKSKEWKDFWDLELGVTYIPWNKLDEKTDLDSLEEGGMFDEDSMPSWIKEKLKNKDVKKTTEVSAMQAPGPAGLLFGIDTTQPPPMAPQNPTAPPPPMMGIVAGQFSMAPPMSGPPQRMLGPPMGPINPMTGMPMPPNLVPGMPPPHMMMPPGMLPPGFPPGMGGPVGAPGPLGLPPGAQFQPHGGPPSAVPPVLAPQNPQVNVSVSSDDQMDVEMELEDAPTTPVATQPQQPPNFNQPPPMFSSTPTESNGPPLGGELFNRDRQRSGGASRWGSRSGDDENGELGGQRWRENGAPGAGGNFNQRNAGGPMNMAPLDMNMQPRPDFMNDFDNRGGARGGPLPPGMGGQRNGDFFQANMNQNRFNQPTSLMQMRIPPPAAFNQQRMGGGPGSAGGNLGPMFGPRNNQSGPPGGRQQGPGFFNPRNPFNDNQRGRGNRGSGSGRGGGRGGPGGGGGNANWSDEDEGNDNFKRRGGPPGSGNRFRDRDDSAERRGPTQRGRAGGNNRSSERDLGSNYNNNRNRRGSRDDTARNSTSSADESMSNNNNKKPENKDKEKKPIAAAGAETVDTEEDWDRELQEYDTKPQGASVKSNNQATEKEQQADIKSNETKAEDLISEQTFVKPPANDSNGESTATITAPAPSTTASPPTTEPVKKQTQSPACTPLYDELPPPTVQAAPSTPIESVPVVAVETPAVEPTPTPRAPTPQPAIAAAASTPEETVPVETPHVVAAAAPPAEVDATA